MGENNQPDFEEIKKAGSDPAAEAEVRKKFTDYFKKHKSNLKFPERLEKLYSWMVSGKLSVRDKALIVGALLYFINPFDAIPDLTPYLGFIDDVGVVTFVYRYLENRAIEEDET